MTVAKVLSEDKTQFTLIKFCTIDTRVRVHNTSLSSYLLNKLDCLSLASLSIQVQFLQVRPRADPSGAPPSLLANIARGWKGLPGTNTLAYWSR